MVNLEHYKLISRQEYEKVININDTILNAGHDFLYKLYLKFVIDPFSLQLLIH